MFSTLVDNMAQKKKTELRKHRRQFQVRFPVNELLCFHASVALHRLHPVANKHKALEWLANIPSNDIKLRSILSHSGNRLKLGTSRVSGWLAFEIVAVLTHRLKLSPHLAGPHGSPLERDAQTAQNLAKLPTPGGHNKAGLESRGPGLTKTLKIGLLQCEANGERGLRIGLPVMEGRRGQIRK